MENPLDPFEIGSSLMKINASWMENSTEFIAAMMALNKEVQDVGEEAFQRFFDNGGRSKKPTRDEKAAFMDLIKKHSSSARKFHTVFSRWLRELVDNTPDVDAGERRRSSFWMGQIVASMAPANFFWTNPGAVRRCIDSKGESLVNGFNNLMEDLDRGDNLIKIVDDAAFEVGENIAATPGQVILRNELLELIQYEPLTETVHPVPVILVQPWINKFYIFDLSARDSFVQYLLKEGFTVFITSWKNPTDEMREASFDDYMLRGALESVNAAREICGVDQVHMAGYCIGGTVLAALMAWLSKEFPSREKCPVADWTLFATLMDFSETGDLGLLVGEDSIEAIDALMEKDGYLDAKYLGLTFRLLNSDSLIWRYHVNNYLYGGKPPRSDMLFWNSDSTRLPARMCTFYLREFYLHNKLVQENALTLGNHPMDLGGIRQPLYSVGALQDHICPWRGTFKSRQPLKGPVRYVLSSEGHITGIVNPPSKRSKKKYWAGDASGDFEPDQWLAAQKERRGSWWPDWTAWLKKDAPGTREPPPMGSEAHPPLGSAPGEYVKEP